MTQFDRMRNERLRTLGNANGLSLFHARLGLPDDQPVRLGHQPVANRSLAGLEERLAGMTPAISATTCRTMSLFPDPPPPPLPSPPAKPKLAPEERRARWADRLIMIRLRMAIWHELEDRDITTPAAIGAALGMPAAEATSLLSRHQWREDDVARLQAVVTRLGVQVPG